MAQKKIKPGAYVPVDAEELAAFKELLEVRPNKAIFLEHLPTDRKTGKPIYSRRQIDYGLERGEMQQALLDELRKFRELALSGQNQPEPA